VNLGPFEPVRLVYGCVWIIVGLVFGCAAIVEKNVYIAMLAGIIFEQGRTQLRRCT
jgi:hypothetical protein